MLNSRAAAQGVNRPFQLLTSMSASLRHGIARLLGVNLERAAGDRAAEAWLIINADLRGLQARSHGPDRQLLPLRNHNWWEILLATARRVGLSIYPGLSEREVERILFDHVASRVLREMSPAERVDVEAIADAVPAVTEALTRVGLSAEAIGFVFAGLHRMTRDVGSTAPGGGSLARTAVALRDAVHRPGTMPSISRTLRFLRENLGTLAEAWTRMDCVRRSLGRSVRQLFPALAVLHLHVSFSEATEEAEALRL